MKMIFLALALTVTSVCAQEPAKAVKAVAADKVCAVISTVISAARPPTVNKNGHGVIRILVT